jgi:PEP-CTERM motif
MKLSLSFLAGTWLVLTGLPIRANPITISNPGFESPALSPNGIDPGVATGWNVSTFAGVWYPGATYFSSVPEGNQVVFLGFGGNSADVNQTLVATLAANTTYTLTYDVGQRFDESLSAYSVDLEANSDVLVSGSGGSPAPGGFVQQVLTFDSGSNPVDLGSPLVIDLSATGFIPGGGSQGQAVFDLFTLDASPTNPSVPEPSSIVLLSAGIAGLALFRRHLRTPRKAAC